MRSVRGRFGVVQSRSGTGCRSRNSVQEQGAGAGGRSSSQSFLLLHPCSCSWIFGSRSGKKKGGLLKIIPERPPF
jgi:hypothetical protein